MPLAAHSIRLPLGRPEPRPSAKLDLWPVAALASVGAVGGVLASAPIGALVGLLAPVSLAWRRVRPALSLAGPLVALVSADAGVIGTLHPATTTALDLAAIIGTYAVVRWGDRRALVIGAALVALAAVVSVGSAWGTEAVRLATLDSLVRWLTPGVAGYVVRLRADAARLRLRDARREERVAIARDLHDALGHHLTAIAVQTQLAQAAHESRPDLALRALGAVEEAASRALVEMRRTVGTLRDPDSAPLAPQQGASALAHLAGASPAGLVVEVNIADDLPPLGPALDAAVFRVAQEAVTNAHRHARDAQRVRVALDRSADDLQLTVGDDGRGVRPTRPGFGLVGMRERTEQLGGHFEAGAAPGGGWRVRASFPLR